MYSSIQKGYPKMNLMKKHNEHTLQRSKTVAIFLSIKVPANRATELHFHDATHPPTNCTHTAKIHPRMNFSSCKTLSKSKQSSSTRIQNEKEAKQVHKHGQNIKKKKKKIQEHRCNRHHCGTIASKLNLCNHRKMNPPRRAAGTSAGPCTPVVEEQGLFPICHTGRPLLSIHPIPVSMSATKIVTANEQVLNLRR